MTSILAIETSTDACSAAICHNNIVQETFVVRPREHNRIILTMVDELLKGLQLTVTDIDAIAFGAGPGSFTGLRLSAGIAQGLAFAAQKPVIPISSLAALALSAAEHINTLPTSTSAPQTLLTIIDARMQDVYFGAYQYKPDPHHEPALDALSDDELLPLSQLPKRFTHYPDAIIIGDGCPSSLIPPSTVQYTLKAYPHARAILSLATKCFLAGKVMTAQDALPVYLRDTISWQKWQPKSGLPFI